MLGSFIWILLLCLGGGIGIMLAVDEFKERHYFRFVFNIMLTLTDIALIIVMIRGMS